MTLTPIPRNGHFEQLAALYTDVLDIYPKSALKSSIFR